MTANRQDGERLAAAERKRFAAVRLSRALAAGLAEPETARLDGDLRAALPSARGERGEDKILYLDTDIIVNGPLTELWDTPLDGAALAGVIDQGALNLWGNYTRTLSYGGIPGYLNAGILLMNLGLIRALSLDRAALDLLNRHRYQFADQDVLNIACKGRTVALDNKWNSGQACGRSAAPVIEHFVCYADFYENPDCAAWQKTKEEYRNFLEKMKAAPSR